MRLSQAQSAQLPLLLAVFSSFQSVIAGPYPKDELHDVGYSFLKPKACVAYCGVYNQYCCTEGQACFTDANTVAYCGAASPTAAADESGSGSGSWVYYTTVYTQTDLEVYTSVYSSYVGGAVATQTQAQVQASAPPAICNTEQGETSCGTICCSNSQRCAYAGQCEVAATSWTYAGYSQTQTQAPTPGYSAPVKGTSGAPTATLAATTTEPFGTAVSATATGAGIVSTSSGGLSGGAIAGIVIGTIAGIILLLLICFCCVLRAGFDGLLAIFGLGKRRRDTVTEVETVERYSRHGSHGAAASRREHSGWFGASAGRRRPTTVVEDRRRKSSGFGGIGAVGAGLLGLAVLLGLKRRHDRKEREKERYSEADSYSYYTDSYTGTSESE